MDTLATFGNIFEFLEKARDRIFRFRVYKRMFTPLEQEHKYCDQDVYECDGFQFGVIREAIALPDGDVLLGFDVIGSTADEDAGESLFREYYKLSEIRLSYYPPDTEEYYGKPL